jgi:hypothetical protein
LSDRYTIPLDAAWFCESCRVISNDETCPNCASHEHSHRLAPWLDREPLVSVQVRGVVISVYESPAEPQRALQAQGEGE